MAVDIAKINGVPVLGQQGAGEVTERAVRRLMLLQGTLAPDQIISLLDLGARTLALGDHLDHIHVGFRPLRGSSRVLGSQAGSLLAPGQWHRLLGRLGEIENPRVATRPSLDSLPARRSRGSGD